MRTNHVRVAFACNDDAGNNTGHAEAVSIAEIELCCQMRRGIVLRQEHGALRVGRKRFAHVGWREWYGNMAWDATWMVLAEAQRLLRHLLACGFTVFESYDEGTPFTAIIEERDAQRLAKAARALR